MMYVNVFLNLFVVENKNNACLRHRVWILRPTDNRFRHMFSLKHAKSRSYSFLFNTQA